MFNSNVKGRPQWYCIRVIDDALVPVEGKSVIRTQAKSLRQYIVKYSPKKAVKISGKTLSRIRNQVIQNYPLYLAGKISKVPGLSLISSGPLSAHHYYYNARVPIQG